MVLGVLWFEIAAWPHKDQGLQIAISMVCSVLWLERTVWPNKDQGLLIAIFRDYILIANFLVMVLLPFVFLALLNYKLFRTIKVGSIFKGDRNLDCYG